MEGGAHSYMMICLYGASVQLIPDAASFIGSIFAFVGFLFDILVQNAGRNGDFWFNVRGGPLGTRPAG
jgi:hypothetical protein